MSGDSHHDILSASQMLALLGDCSLIISCFSSAMNAILEQADIMVTSSKIMQTFKKKGNNYYCVHYISVPFPSDREAQIAHGSLSVDKEPRRGGVERTMRVHGNILYVHFEAHESRLLRVGINSFFDYLKFVSYAMENLGPPR